jgi:hypothetical protein
MIGFRLLKDEIATAFLTESLAMTEGVGLRGATFCHCER